MSVRRPFAALSAAWIACLLTAPVRAQDDQDVRAALAAAREQAESGDVVAQFTLGSVLSRGGGDLDEALKWLRMAAAQGHAPAEFQLGQWAEFGRGMARDSAAALQWYRRAARHGLPSAQRALGDAYRIGVHVRPDLSEAARWYRLAAAGGDLRAQYHLGQLHFDGAGVARDYVEAYVWFDLAAHQTPLEDNRKALIELRNIAAVRMSASELADATRLVRERLQRHR